MMLKKFGWGKGSNYGGNNKNNFRFYTHYNINGHSVEFYYQNYGHPYVNKTNSYAFSNATSSVILDTQNTNIDPDTNSVDHTLRLTQEKYDKLVCLL